MGRRRRVGGPAGRLHAGRRRAGPPGLRQPHVGVRRHLHRLPGLRLGHRHRRHVTGPPLRLPADRGGRDVVPVPDHRRRPAGARPPPLGRDARQDLHEPDHQLGQPGDHVRQQRARATVPADHPRRPVGGFRRDGAADPLLRHGVPGHLAGVLGYRPDDRVLAGAGQPDRAERLQRGDELRLVERGQRGDRLRRVLLPAGAGLPRREDAQQRRLLHAADAVQRGGRAGEGADQHGQELAELPPAEPRRRLHGRRPAHLPALVVRVHDRADGRLPVAGVTGHHGNAPDARRLRLLRDLPGPAGDRPDRLLTVAGEPRRGGFRPDPEAAAGGTRHLLAGPEHLHVRQPDVHPRPPGHQLPGDHRADAAGVRQGRRRPLRGRRDPDGAGRRRIRRGRLRRRRCGRRGRLGQRRLRRVGQRRLRRVGIRREVRGRRVGLWRVRRRWVDRQRWDRRVGHGRQWLRGVGRRRLDQRRWRLDERSSTSGGSSGRGSTGAGSASSGTTAGGGDGNGTGAQLTGDAAGPIVNASLGEYTSENLTGELAPVAAGLLLLVFVVPAVVALRLARRRREDDLPA
jgi:hypothetical protein